MPWSPSSSCSHARRRTGVSPVSRTQRRADREVALRAAEQDRVCRRGMQVNSNARTPVKLERRRCARGEVVPRFVEGNRRVRRQPVDGSVRVQAATEVVWMGDAIDRGWGVDSRAALPTDDVEELADEVRALPAFLGDLEGEVDVERWRAVVAADRESLVRCGREGKQRDARGRAGRPRLRRGSRLTRRSRPQPRSSRGKSARPHDSGGDGS